MKNLEQHKRSHAGLVAASFVLLAQTACGQLTLPPGDGTSLAERRRMLGEDAAAGITVIPKRSPENASASPEPGAASEGGTGSTDASAGTTTSDAPAGGDLPPPSGRTMGEAKKLSSPDLGIRLPIGQPALTPRPYAPQE